MRILGAILAGGAASRFGSDKAEALIGDKPMIAHVIARLRPQVDQIVICGRSWGDLAALADRPKHGMGPLGGLAAALHHAAGNRFEAVLTAGCDLPDLPADLAGQLLPAPAVVKGQPLLGLWGNDLAPALDAYLAGADDLSMAAWIRETGARRVEIGRAVSNINTPGDLLVFKRKADPRS